jgi:hypothetical protein
MRGDLGLNDTVWVLLHSVGVITMRMPISQMTLIVNTALTDKHDVITQLTMRLCYRKSQCTARLVAWGSLFNNVYAQYRLVKSSTQWQ